jgi:hypothetical protein
MTWNNSSYLPHQEKILQAKPAGFIWNVGRLCLTKHYAMKAYGGVHV